MPSGGGRSVQQRFIVYDGHCLTAFALRAACGWLPALRFGSCPSISALFLPSTQAPYPFGIGTARQSKPLHDAGSSASAGEGWSTPKRCRVRVGALTVMRRHGFRSQCRSNHVPAPQSEEQTGGRTTPFDYWLLWKVEVVPWHHLLRPVNSYAEYLCPHLACQCRGWMSEFTVPLTFAVGPRLSQSLI